MENMENQVSGTETKKSFGPLIGVIIIIVVLLLGAFYIWGGKLSNDTDVVSDELTPVSTSDEVSAIESDLTAGGVSEIDFSDVEAGLQ